MMEKNLIAESLQKTTCPKCGSSLQGARFVMVSENLVSLVAHATCPSCKAESMLTLTPTGSGISPVYTDLISSEIEKFTKGGVISYDDVLDLHLALKKEKLWNLLDKKEKNSAKRTKA